MLQLYSETEFVIDSGDSADSFLYTWTEFEVAPVDWFRFGLVAQRTKVYQTAFDIQRGFFAGSPADAQTDSIRVQPDADRPTVVVTVGWASRWKTATSDRRARWPGRFPSARREDKRRSPEHRWERPGQDPRPTWGDSPCSTLTGLRPLSVALPDQHEVWLTKLSRRLGRPATLDDVPDAEFGPVRRAGFDWSGC